MRPRTYTIAIFRIKLHSHNASMMLSENGASVVAVGYVREASRGGGPDRASSFGADVPKVKVTFATCIFYLPFRN